MKLTEEQKESMFAKNMTKEELVTRARNIAKDFMFDEDWDSGDTSGDLESLSTYFLWLDDLGVFD